MFLYENKWLKLYLNIKFLLIISIAIKDFFIFLNYRLDLINKIVANQICENNNKNTLYLKK